MGQRCSAANQKRKDNPRMKRFFGDERPKTYNKAFGGLKDFLLFFERRGPEINSFAKTFNAIEVSQDLSQLKQNILPIIVQAIKQESQKVKGNQGKKKLIKLFQRKVDSFQKFYGTIIKAYTIEGFLYKNLNRYLRNEDWTNLDTLLPYAYCLCKAFLSSELSSTYNKFGEHLINVNVVNMGNIDNKIILYRGAQLDEHSLSFYQAKTTRNFSWNAVTSTSTDHDIAECYMWNNTDGIQKLPVMFVIEVPISPGSSKGLGWIDIEHLSLYPTEKEVVLAPGSTFQVIDFFRNDQGAEIRLRLITDVSILAYEGEVMHAVMHTEMSLEKEAKIVCLEGTDLTEALYHLKGNRLIEQIELASCKYNANTLQILREVFPTMQNLSRLIYFSVSSKGTTNLDMILKALDKKKMLELKIDDRLLADNENIMLFARELREMSILASLHLDFERCEKITNEEVTSLCSQGIQHLTSLTSLHLNFNECENITDEGVTSLSSQAIQHLISLIVLHLKFSGCQQITDKGLTSLCSQGIRHLTSLTSLYLDFIECENITDEGLTSLSSQGIQHLISLTALYLMFSGCKQITDKGLTKLCSQGIRHLVSLTTLDLEFSCCKQITDEGLTSLSSQGIRHLTSLTTLYLNLGNCDKITDVGLAGLCFLGIQHLTTLHLKFSLCKQITDEGLTRLCSQGIRYLTSLTTLDLSFGTSFNITDKGLTNLSSRGIQHLKSLTSLRLDFQNCWSLTDEGLTNLSSQGIRHLTSLTTLHLDFRGCFSITYEGLKNLSASVSMSKVSLVLNRTGRSENIPSQHKFCQFKRRTKDNLFTGIEIESEIPLPAQSNLEFIDDFSEFRNLCINSNDHHQLRFIKSINLNLHESNESAIDEDLMNIGRPLKYLISLTTLHLHFRGCSKITDEGLTSLCSQGIRHLTSLTTLHLDFGDCIEITDEGLTSLSSQGIQHLKSLTTLYLDFRRCLKITDEGLTRLSSKGIRHLTSLTTLYLFFVKCEQITDEGLTSLCSQGIRHLASLTALYLNFRSCKNITDEGLTNLCSQGIQHLISLTTLHVNFDECENITYVGFRDLKLLLKYFGYYPSRIELDSDWFNYTEQSVVSSF